MELDTQMHILDTILDEYKIIVEKYYPDIIKGMGYGSDFNCHISPYFRNYKKTPFYFKGELKFVHWTSLTNLSSIINNGELRLYNLINSEDEEEFTYAAKLLSLSKSQIAVIKDRYFTASFCVHSNLNNEYLWDKYGKNYKGVAIVFSLIENRDQWEDFFLSDVYYDLDPTFSEFQKEVEALRAKYNSGMPFTNDIWRFAGFYKRDCYKDENEVRLAGIFPFKNEKEYLRYTRKEIKIEKGRNRIVTYIPLKLWSHPESMYFKTLDINNRTAYSFSLNDPKLPQLKIHSVYFGKNCGLEEREYLNFRFQLLEMFRWRLGYSIDLPEMLYK